MGGESYRLSVAVRLEAPPMGCERQTQTPVAPERGPWGLAGFQGSELGSLLEHFNLGSVLGSSVLQI